MVIKLFRGNVLIMFSTIVLINLVIVPVFCSQNDPLIPRAVGSYDRIDTASGNAVLDNTRLVLSFVVFRHGDRTPDPEELEKYPSSDFDNSIFHPHGKKALTNRGKQRAFLTGQYLRRQYNESISELYLANEISVRTTDYSRTKMTALVVLAGMYPPPLAQRWSDDLNWQPIPYDTMPSYKDDLLHFDNCPRYNNLRIKVYDVPEVREVIDSSKGFLQYLSEQTKGEIETPEHVFLLDNLFQTLNNTGVTIPKWAEDSMPAIKGMTKIEYSCMFYNTELIRLAAGVLMTEIVEAMEAAVKGDEEQPKLRLYSAHENNVAALLAAARAFEPHQPNYGSTVSLELRKDLDTGKYGVMVVYAANAGGPGVILPIAGCGEKSMCDYETFIELTKEVLMKRSEYIKKCSTLD